MSQHRTFPNSAVFYTFIYHTSPKFLEADSGLSLHATLFFCVGNVISAKITWLPTNHTAPYYKTAKGTVISTDWSHLCYSDSS